jgi:hypothetical protein
MSFMRSRYFFALCSVIAACNNRSHATDSATHSPPSEAAGMSNLSVGSVAPVAPGINIVATGSNQNATAPLPANPRDISALFQTEAASRPTGTIRAEDAIAALRKDGMQIDEVKQHLGRPYGARYCLGGKSSALVAISVCEYIDPAAAKAGAAVSEKIPLPNREIHINQATSLTVRDLEKTPAADALAKRMFDSFAKLKTS